MKTKVVHIGKQAIDIAEPVLILFGPTATPAIQEVSVIQETMDDSLWKPLKAGDEIAFDGQKYAITAIGPAANENLRLLGHTTIVFQEPTEGRLPTNIYVVPAELPIISIGTVIDYIPR